MRLPEPWGIGALRASRAARDTSRNVRFAERTHPLSVLLAGLAVVSAAVLLVGDVVSRSPSAGVHSVLSALPLALAAAAVLTYPVWRSPLSAAHLKAVLLGTAFLLWAGDQLLPSAWWLDDLAIALFVLDVGLVAAERRAD